MTAAGAGRVAIIGGGWAGLAAAHDLAAAGAAVHLFEMAPQAGGRARTVALRLAGRDLLLDNGQHLLIGAYTRTLARLASLGLPADHGLTRLPLQFESGAFSLRRQGPGRAGLLAGLLRARGLGKADRLALVRLGLSLARARWQGQQGRTLVDLLRRTGQTEHLVRVFWRPFCLAAMNTPPEQACAQTFVNVLRDSLLGGADGSDFLVPSVPLGALLADPLLDRLRRDGVQVSLKTPVRGLAGNGGQWALARSARPAQALLGCFDQVVIATASPHAAGLLEAVAPAVAQRLRCFEHRAILTTYLAWPAGQAPVLPAVRMLDEVPARRWHGQWLFDRGVTDGLRLASVVTSARDTIADDDNARLAAGIVEQVGAAVGLPAPSDWTWVNERRATYSCTPGRPAGHPRGIDELALPEGLYLAGDYATPRYPATLEGALRSGEATALAVLHDRAGPGQPASPRLAPAPRQCDRRRQSAGPR